MRSGSGNVEVEVEMMKCKCGSYKEWMRNKDVKVKVKCGRENWCQRVQGEVNVEV